MNKIHIILFLLIIFTLFTCNKKLMEPAYKNPGLPIEKRVQDLLKRMTLEEKAAQMVAVAGEIKDSIEFSADGSINIEKIKPLLANGVGQLTRPSETRGWQSQTKRVNKIPA